MIVEVPEQTRLAVIGDIHCHSEQFFKILEEINPRKNMWLVSVGDVVEKGFGIRAFEKITDKLIELENKGICFATIGNHEKKVIKKAKGTDKMTPQLKWWKNRPLSITFNFKSGSIVTVLHAGVTPKMTKEDIERNIEVLYVRDVDVDGKMIPLIWKDIDGVKTLIKSKEGGESWHNKYLGQFGYIASGHAAQKDGIAKFYKYSCNLDSGVYETGILTAQVFDENGNLGKLITVEGPAAKPDIHVAY